jgi:hypothetical protein
VKVATNDYLSTMNPSLPSPADRLGQSLQTLIAEIADCLDEIAFSHADCPGFCTCYVDPETQRCLDCRLVELAERLASRFGTCGSSLDGRLTGSLSRKIKGGEAAIELTSRVQYLRELLVYAAVSPALLADLESRFREFVRTLGSLESELASPTLAGVTTESDPPSHGAA